MVIINVVSRVVIIDQILQGDKKNKDLVKLKQDLEERARLAERNKAANNDGDIVETMYIDNTRNVGVLLGEKDLGKHIKKQRFEVRNISLLLVTMIV